ncbi:DUF2255 family protein [Lipomyces arxii]|uniref:DUF2255 family protein n=1 Tax=Lipomyces arxii TaxID=56418 RepID=UPI0034CF4678
MAAKLATKWPKSFLTKISQSDDLKIAPFRADGKTYGTPTWIWSVAVGDGLYVRSYSGVQGRWYQSALSQKAGRIYVGGEPYEVVFEHITDQAVNDAIDDAFQVKYAKTGHVHYIVNPRTNVATIKISPRE